MTYRRKKHISLFHRLNLLECLKVAAKKYPSLSVITDKLSRLAKYLHILLILSTYLGNTKCVLTDNTKL